ncbi:MAG: Gmad2 immunoglobulin-like domain-containing protein [Patescibacteria group bacterium]|nr:Gmad2 immunoglobulin-like domain-containing protein [Patescibacteria group bacterium]
MDKTRKLIFAVVGVIGLAAALAFFVSWRNALMTPTDKGAGQVEEPSDNDGQGTGEEDTTGFKPLSEESCAERGGTWNDCGSLCRGKPAGTVCAQVCVPQCECRSQEQCPTGYACGEILDDGVGICMTKQPQKEPMQEDAPTSLNEFKSEDGVTSVVLDAQGSGIYPPTLFNPFGFSGTTTAFENNLSWQLLQSDGKVVARGYTYVDSPDIGIPGDFRVKGFYDVIPSSPSGTLMVYEASAKDGEPIHVVSIPVLLPTAKMQVYVYWGNSQKNPNAADCSLVYPVAHEVTAYHIKDKSDVEVAMHELLKGPTKWELSQGYYTSLPQNVPQPELKKNDEVAFSEDLEREVGGSCRVSAIRAQIVETYKRNAEMDTDPIISIDGRTEDILQP